MGVYERQQREKKIIEAAIRLFSVKGMYYTTMDEVARQAKISKGLTYFYFKSKEDLYMAITRKGFDDLKDVFTKIHTKGKDNTGFENISDLVEQFLVFTTEKRLYYECILYFLGIANLHNDPAKHEMIPTLILESPYFQKLLHIQHDIPSIGVKMISKGIRDGSIRPELQPETTFYTIWSMLIGYERVKGSVDFEPKELKIHAEVWKNSFLKFLYEMLKGTQYAHKFQPVQGKLF
jgi:AcrR family transcriptional regulator